MVARARTAPSFAYGFNPATAAAHTDAPGREVAIQASHAAAVISSGLPPILVDDDGAAMLLGVSKRTFTDLIDAPWMCRPIRLGPRLRRWSTDELRAAVAGMPRETERAPQPSALRARIDALKGGADAR